MLHSVGTNASAGAGNVPGRLACAGRRRPATGTASYLPTPTHSYHPCMHLLRSRHIETLPTPAQLCFSSWRGATTAPHRHHARSICITADRLLKQASPAALLPASRMTEGAHCARTHAHSIRVGSAIIHYHHYGPLRATQRSSRTVSVFRFPHTGTHTDMHMGILSMRDVWDKSRISMWDRTYVCGQKKAPTESDREPSSVRVRPCTLGNLRATYTRHIALGQVNPRARFSCSSDSSRHPSLNK